MKPEAQRLAIAEACGWTHIREADPEFCIQVPWKPNTLIGLPPASSDGHIFLPDYLNDLNAMHEAEKALHPELPYDKPWITYRSQLLHLEPNHPTHTTAAQRAEAFLQTIGKWVD